MRTLAHQLVRYADTDATIVIRGETGSGKERVARWLHALSTRTQGQFMAVNCGAIPSELVEAELFGTTAGAFTGARQRPGWFERAHQGTLLLDEIGEMPLAAQAVLLRVLEDGVFWRVGSERPTKVDVRILCATHRNLEADVRTGRFRLDLFHRISALILEVPPLRKRREDLHTLTEQLLPTHVHRLTPAAWRALEKYPWPGNIRELKNVLVRASLNAQSPKIGPNDLDLRYHEDAPTVATKNGTTALKPLDQVVSQYVLDAVRGCEGNVRAAARHLKVSPTTVYRYLAMGSENSR